MTLDINVHGPLGVLNNLKSSVCDTCGRTFNHTKDYPRTSCFECVDGTRSQTVLHHPVGEVKESEPAECEVPDYPDVVPCVVEPEPIPEPTPVPIPQAVPVVESDIPIDSTPKVSKRSTRAKSKPKAEPQPEPKPEPKPEADSDPLQELRDIEPSAEGDKCEECGKFMAGISAYEDRCICVECAMHDPKWVEINKEWLEDNGYPVPTFENETPKPKPKRTKSKK